MCILGRFSVRSKRASKQLLRWWTSGSASGVAEAARGATDGRRRNRMAWELASSAQTTHGTRARDRGVQPCLFWSDDYANAHSCSGYGASQRCATSTVRSITATRRSACESDAPFCRAQTHDIDKRRWGGSARRDPCYVHPCLLDAPRRSCVCRRRAARRGSTSTTGWHASAARAAPRAAPNDFRRTRTHPESQEGVDRVPFPLRRIGEPTSGRRPHMIWEGGWAPPPPMARAGATRAASLRAARGHQRRAEHCCCSLVLAQRLGRGARDASARPAGCRLPTSVSLIRHLAPQGARMRL